MKLNRCKTDVDVKNWGLEYMKKRGFTPLKIEIEDQFMKFFGAKFGKEDLENEAKQRWNKEWYVKIAGAKLNKTLPYDMCMFKVDLAKYVQEYKEKYEVSTDKVVMDADRLRQKLPILPSGFTGLQVV